ncbi:hypothetical protein BJD13_00345 (plasmid) [Xanthomonas perforans]|nr:hypothetical protein BJD13_00345 [Xanthomonas perforans]
MKQPSRPRGGGTTSAEAALEASFERARGSAIEERAFFHRLMDAIVYVHAPVSDDAPTPRLVQFRHPDGFDAIPFFTSLDKAQAASSAAVRILGVSGRELLTGTRGATLMLNPNDGGVVLYPEEVAAFLDTGFLARVDRYSRRDVDAQSQRRRRCPVPGRGCGILRYGLSGQGGTAGAGGVRGETCPGRTGLARSGHQRQP